MSRVQLILIAVFALAALMLPWLGDSYQLRIASRMLIFAIAALGVDFLLANVGLLTLGHTMLFATGAYVTGLLTLGGWTPALAVWPLAMLAVALLSAAVGALALRTTGLYFIMITLAFAQMLFYFLQGQRRLGGDEGFAIPHRNALPLIDLSDHTQFYYLVLASLALILLAVARVRATPFGAAIEACRDSERRVVAMGLNPFWFKFGGFMISGLIVGFAGVLYANNTLYLTPDLSGWHLGGELLVMVILGGSGTLMGPILGAILFALLQEYLSEVTQYWMFWLGLLLVLRVLLLRDGFWTLLQRGTRRR